VGHIAYGDGSGSCQLGVTFQAQIVVPLNEHLLVDRAMGVMAGCAPFPQRLVLKHMRASLLTVTLQTGLILPRDKHAFRLVYILAMWIVAISATHPSFFDRVAVLEAKQCPSFEMALETCFRVFAGIDDELAAASTYFQVQAAGAVTRFAALTLQSLPFLRNLNARVTGVFEVLGNLFVALGARFHPYVLSTLNRRRGSESALHRRARNNE
jgi:hypothetical protein